MTTILAFLAVLAVLIMVHELGHFLTAKAYRVKVLEFGLGFPPRLLSFPRREIVASLEARIDAFRSDQTVYTLNAVPLGGFVRLTGEDSLELRLLVKCAAESEIEAVRHALHAAQASLSEAGSRALVKVVGVEVGPVTPDDVATARNERAEVLGLGVPVQPEAARAANRGRTRVTSSDASLEPAETVARFCDGFASEVEHGLTSKGTLTRTVILAAGSFMNLLLPLVIFVFIFMLPTETLEGRVRILEVSPDSPVEQAGILPGDIVQRVDGHRVANTTELAYRIRLKLGQSTTWDLLREKPRITGFLGGGGDPGLQTDLPPAEATTHTVTLVPRWKPPPEEGNAGVFIATEDGRIVSRSIPVWEAVPQGFVRMWETLVLFRNEIIGMFIGASDVEIAGPVGIAQITGEVARAGWMPTLELMALLSLNLAIINILPIPALDGGRLIFVALEWVRRGKRISPQREGLVHAVGFMVLISLIAVVSGFDILRILRGESLLR